MGWGQGSHQTYIQGKKDAVKLLPIEDMALTVALAQTLRGDPVPENTTAQCILALARITGKHDWTAD